MFFLLSKYTRECVQVRPLSTRLINRVKLAGPFVNLKGITLVYLFNSFSGHEPAQRECAWTGLMQGAIPTQSHHPLRLATPRGVYEPYSFLRVLWVLLCPIKTNQGKCCEMGPTVSRPYPRKLENISICRCHYIGSTFLVRPRFEPATSCSQTGALPTELIRWQS